MAEKWRLKTRAQMNFTLGVLIYRTYSENPVKQQSYSLWNEL